MSENHYPAINEINELARMAKTRIDEMHELACSALRRLERVEGQKKEIICATLIMCECMPEKQKDFLDLIPIIDSIRVNGLMDGRVK